jgi:hypothetical protein
MQGDEIQSERKRAVGRRRRRWEDNIKLMLKNSVEGGFKWLRMRTSGGIL